jgi:hypothetical protein
MIARFVVARSRPAAVDSDSPFVAHGEGDHASISTTRL